METRVGWKWTCLGPCAPVTQACKSTHGALKLGLHYQLDAWKFPIPSENLGLSLNHKTVPD